MYSKEDLSKEISFILRHVEESLFVCLLVGVHEHRDRTKERLGKYDGKEGLYGN